MSTPSMLLLCAGAASSLASVWALAGLSETSQVKPGPRAVAAAGVGLLTTAALYFGAGFPGRAELSLPLLFGAASVLALAVGAAKIEGALSDKDGPRVVRRAAGIVSGTVFGMAAIGAASLDLSRAAAGWALMFGLVAAAFVVFAQRARYAGVALLALGRRSYVLVLLAGALVFGAGFACHDRETVSAPVRRALPADPEPSAAAVASAPPDAPASAPPATSAAPDAAIASAAATPSGAPSAAAPPAGNPGELQIEGVVSRGLLEADARGGVQRRLERLQVCLADPKNRQSGALTLKIGIDASGSVAYSRATGGDLVGTPLAACLLPQFYKMGFAAPASNNAGFDITLRAP